MFCSAVVCGAVAVGGGGAAEAQQPRDQRGALEPAPFTAVRFDDGFWTPRLETNRRTTVGYCFAQCEDTGRIRNFAVAGGLEEGAFEGIFYNDSDVYKVIEGAAYSLLTGYDAELDAYLDGLIEKIAAAQEADGYLFTQRTIQGEAIDSTGAGPERWSNLSFSHELYNVGHMYEAAVAHWQATGKRSLLDVAIRSADLVCEVFGPGEGQRKDVPGHQEIEIGLVKLYRATGERKYLEQARFFLDMRGREDVRGEIYGEYCQDHAPVVEQDEPVGHAVRAGYMYAGMADVAAMADAPGYMAALERIWERLVGARMYVTGGIGAHRHNEGFGEDYDLPNAEAYNETCAAIASMLWNHRMFLATGDAKYMDVFERTLYNGFLAGVSLSGDRFFYPNPLASDGRDPFNHGHVQRAPWFGTSCCPVNVVRVAPSLPGYVYATGGRDLYVSLFVAGEAELETEAGKVRLTQETDYPWDGRIRIVVAPEREASLALRVRVPGWARGEALPGGLYEYHEDEPAAAGDGRLTVRINGEAFAAPVEGGYAVIDRAWAAGDAVEFELPMPVRTVRSDELVKANRDRLAVERGPLVYCFEAVDNEGRVEDLVVAPGAAAQADWRFEPALLGGVGVIELPAVEATRTEGEGGVSTRAVTARAVPYYAWAHREVGPMAVWVAATPEVIARRPGPTAASKSRASASHCWRGDSVEAINDLKDPDSSSDHSIPRMTWWDHRGTTEWAQLETPSEEEISAVSVYFFDDTGRGHCRVPESWRVLVRRDGQWRPVEASAPYEVVKDGWSRAEFAPVRAEAVRVEVRLREGYSGGILEMKLE